LAARVLLSGISQGHRRSKCAPLAGQKRCFSANAITGQTASVTGSQNLTNAAARKVQDLQGETVSITAAGR